MYDVYTMITSAKADNSPTGHVSLFILIAERIFRILQIAEYTATIQSILRENYFESNRTTYFCI